MKKQKEIILILLILLITCCDMSTPPIREEHMTAQGRSVELPDEEETYDWIPILSILIPPAGSAPLSLVDYTEGISLPGLFSPMTFRESRFFLGESEYMNVPTLIRDFYRIELYGTASVTEASSDHKCTVMLHGSDLKISVNGEGLHKYTEPHETVLPVEVTVRAESKEQTKVRYLSAGISYNVSL